MIKRVAVAALLALCLITPAVQAQPLRPDPSAGCRKTFTIRMTERAARAIYAGTGRVHRHQLRVLGTLERCQRNPRAVWFARWYDHNQAAQHHHRIWEQQHPIQYGVASWYDDAGGTACGFHAGYGVANLSLPCGTKVTFYYGKRSVTAVVQDRGPYVAGREWDLNQNTAGALGFDGVQTLGYRIG